MERIKEGACGLLKLRETPTENQAMLRVQLFGVGPVTPRRWAIGPQKLVRNYQREVKMQK